MRRILIVRFSSLGDIILTEPVIRALRLKYPQAAISYLTKSKFLSVLELMAGIDQTFGLTDDSEMSELIDRLRREEYDLLIDLHYNIRSQRVRSKLKAAIWSAKKEWWRRFCAVKLKRIAAKPSHAVERYLAAVPGLTAVPSSPSLTLPQEYQDWWRRERSSRRIPGDYYIIGAGAAHDTKMAPRQLWRDLRNAVAAEWQLSPLLIGAPNERETLLTLADDLDMSDHHIVTEDHICHAAAAIAGARFVLSNDSGLAHLAAGLGLPTMVLFGPTHPVLGFAPLGTNADHYTVNEYCSPCSRHGKRKCYRSERYCFTRMDAAAILSKLKRLIGH
ncbi:MAG: glycosyltransferase family 9 protein [candidate division Zixibacteria bacterium]|nr:glycosyltransferase family 9 protein [candidate division Zixibacteria bacterium]